MAQLESSNYGNATMDPQPPSRLTGARDSTVAGSYTGSRSGSPTLDDARSNVGFNGLEKGKGKGDVHTGVYPSNSFDVYGNEESADSQ